MSRRPAKPPKYRLSYLPDVVSVDLPALAALDVALLDAVAAAVDDLAHGRQRGKALSVRHVSGDLSGLLRLRFDLPTRSRQHRYRIVYRPVADASTVEVIEVVAIGERATHEVYRISLTRVADA